MSAHVALVRQLLAPLARRVRMLATKALVSQADDSLPLQMLQLTALAGERLSNVQRIQQFGSRGNPPAGSQALLICVGGSRSFPVVVAVENPGAAPAGSLPSGGYEIYDANGTYLRFNNDGTFYLKAATSGVVDCPTVEFTGNAVIDGNLTVKQNLLVDQNATILGVLEAEGVDGSGNSITTVGKIAGGADVSDSHGTMQAMRGVFNTHTQPVVSGTAEAPPVPM